MKEHLSKTKSTIINTLASIFNRFINILLSFILRTAFIYALGVQYTGVSSVFSDILTMLSLSELGMETAISTALYIPLRKNDKVQIRKLMKFYRGAYCLIAGFITITGLMLLPFLNTIITDVPDIQENIYCIYILYIIKTASSYLLIYKTTLLNADQKQYVAKKTETVCTVIRYTIEIMCVCFLRQFMIYLCIEVAATILQNIVVTRQAEKLYPYAFEKTKDRLDKTQIRGLLQNIKGLAMYRISGTVGNSIDNILVSVYISTSTVGMLANYTLIRKQIEAVLNQFFTALIPSLGHLAAEGTNEKQYMIFKRIFYLNFLVVNFCAVSMMVLFKPFITLWLGEDYLLSTEISFVIGIDCFLYVLLQVIASFRTANGLFVKGQYRPLVTAILNIILSVIFVQKYGILGTISATVICRLMTQWYDPYLLYKSVFQKKFSAFYGQYWRYIIIFFSGCVLTFLLAEHVNFSSLLISFLARVLCCVTIPNLWAILWTIFTPEFKYVVSVIHNIYTKRKLISKSR